MKNVLVLGGTGLIGSFLIPELSKLNLNVLALSRNKQSATDAANVSWLKFDLNDALPEKDFPTFEIVISMLSSWATAEFLTKINCKPIQTIAFSSTSAFTKEGSSDPAERELARRLLVGEERLKAFQGANGLSIIRPTMIYGGHGDRNVERVVSQLKRLRLFPLFGNGSGLRQPVHAEDLAIAISALLQKVDAPSKTYNLGGGEVLSFRKMIQRIGEMNDVAPIFVRFPGALSKVFGLTTKLPVFRGIPSESFSRMQKDMVFDYSEATQDFGYQPRLFVPQKY